MQRKTVTVLFCDVTGSTALGESIDPEALREVLARYFERMSGIVESHGGTVEKFIGDAVMAVFGVPTAHEDDALRAVRAAAEMRDALPELGVQARIGLNTFDNETDFTRHDLIRIARQASPYHAPVWIDIGNRDQLRPGAAALAQGLKADGADVSFHVWPGSHDGRYWDAHFGDYLRFYADACS